MSNRQKSCNEVDKKQQLRSPLCVCCSTTTTTNTRIIALAAFPFELSVNDGLFKL